MPKWRFSKSYISRISYIQFQVIPVLFSAFLIKIVTAKKTTMATPCAPGKLSTLTFDNPDCPECRGIKNITQSADKLSMTIYYTDGTSQVFSLPTVTGATGAAGAAGATGVVILHNDTDDSTTTTNALETLKTFPMVAGQMATDGDILQIRARFRANADAIQKWGYIYLDGVALIGWYMQDNPVTGMDFTANISRTSATAGDLDAFVDVKATVFFFIIQAGRLFAPINAVSATWANAMDIEIMANDQAGNAITCELFQVTYIKSA